jgi:hypothetical protein
MRDMHTPYIVFGRRGRQDHRGVDSMMIAANILKKSSVDNVFS